MISAASSAASEERAHRIGVRTVVCAVGDLECAARPTVVARQLSERLGDELVLVHAVPPLPVVYTHQAYSHAVLPEDRRRLVRAAEATLDDVARGCGVDAARRVAVVGVLSTAVLDVVDEERAELVVVGSRRRGLFTRAVLGSSGAEIADGTDVPVLVVPSSGPLRPLEPIAQIVCGVDAGQPARRAASVAWGLSRRLGAELLLVTAAGSRADGLRLIEALIEDEGLPPDTARHVRRGHAAPALELAAADVDAALIVVGRRGGVVRDLLRCSVSATLKARARRPVVLA